MRILGLAAVASGALLLAGCDGAAKASHPPSTSNKSSSVAAATTTPPAKTARPVKTTPPVRTTAPRVVPKPRKSGPVSPETAQALAACMKANALYGVFTDAPTQANLTAALDGTRHLYEPLGGRDPAGSIAMAGAEISVDLSFINKNGPAGPISIEETTLKVDIGKFVLICRKAGYTG
jgi:hypothetical protein